MSKYILTQGGCTDWRIVMSHPAHETVKLAADELHDFVMKMSGASLPVQTELVADGDHEILVGRSGRLAHYGIEVDWDSLGEEGYVIRSDEHYLLLAGATPRGTLYAVYAFLEEELGCRWFSSECSRIPRKTLLTYGKLDRTDRPAFESREAYWRDAYDGKFAVRNRMNSNKADISIRQGGRMKFYNFHHSFDDLVSPDEYFDTHPEYFSMIDGKRVKERTQLCLTNPDVLKLSIKRVKQWIHDNPDCRVFSVAQNDWHNYCTCPNCAAIDEREGSPAGTMIHFVNALTEEIVKDHPHVLIHTFAYQYTRKAPRFVRPHPNVVVRLCSIECCFSHPLNGTLIEALHPEAATRVSGHRNPQCASQGETAFLTDLREWSKICDRLYIWDYVTMFSNYLMPFPNFDVLDKNLQLFRDLGVKGILEQGDFAHGGGGHLAELQAYLQAKLMWNPDCNMRAHMEDFVAGFYGEAAAPLILAYIDLWQQAIRPWHMSINQQPNAPHITDELLDKSVNLLGEALFVTDDAQQRLRINRLMLGINFLILRRMPAGTPGRDALITRLGWQLREAGICELHERWTLEEAIERLRKPEGEVARTIKRDYKM